MNNSEVQTMQPTQPTQPMQSSQPAPTMPVPQPTPPTHLASPTPPTHLASPTPPALPPRTTSSSSSGSSEYKAEKPGSLIGSRIKGIARIIHGAGEAVRGYGMSTLDNTISNKARGAVENGEITRRGQEEIQRGLDDLKWKTSSSDHTTTN